MKTKSFHSSVMEELFDGISGITSRAMFGGYGIYREGVIFALIVEEDLYFKTDQGNVDDYKEAGSHPFTYQKENGKVIAMSYWLLPDQIMKNRQKLLEWIDLAHAASKRGKKRSGKAPTPCD